MKRIFLLDYKVLLTLIWMSAALQGCGQKQDACALIKEDGGYAQTMEEVVCSPSAPQYIKDLIGAVIVSHSDKHKPEDALDWVNRAVKTNNNIVSQLSLIHISEPTRPY